LNQPSASVVIVTQDRAHLAEASIRSVLLQTQPAAQIVLVDDGSLEPAAAARLAELSPLIELVRLAVARGPAAARNCGLAQVRGEFVLFLDDDDLIHPRFLEDGLAVLSQRRDADVVVFLYECIFTPQSLGESYPVALLFDYERLPTQPLRIADDGNPAIRQTLEQRPVSAFLRYTIPIHSCLVRRAAIGELHFPESLRQGEDTYFWISLASAGRRFVLDDRVYSFVRRHPGNTTHSRRRYVEEIQSCYEMLLENHLLAAADDVFLAHLKLFWFKNATGRPGRLRHLAHLAASPRLLALETRFWLANLHARRRLLKYYFGR